MAAWAFAAGVWRERRRRPAGSGADGHDADRAAIDPQYLPGGAGGHDAAARRGERRSSTCRPRLLYRGGPHPVFGPSRVPMWRRNFPDSRQVHYVVRSALWNFPDLVTVQVDPAGPGSQHADHLVPQRVWPKRSRGEPERDDKPGSPPCNSPRRDEQTMGSLGLFLKDTWRLARPYFVESEERLVARGLLAAVIALSLAIGRAVCVAEFLAAGVL